VPLQFPVQPMLPYVAPPQVPSVSAVMSVPPVAHSSAQLAPAALTTQATAGDAQVLSSAVEPVKPKRIGKCWKCAVDTHATKDCTVLHYYLVCNNVGHP
jgi:hypothetical protein